MTGLQVSKLNMYRSITSLFDENMVLIYPIFGLVNAINKLKGLVLEISSKDRIINIQFKGTIDKDIARDILIYKLLSVSPAIHSLGRETKNYDLLKISATILINCSKLDDNELCEKADRMLSICNLNSATLVDFGLQNVVISELEQYLVNFELACDKLALSGSLKKSARKEVASLFSQAESLILHEMDRIMVQIKRYHPGLYKEYVSLRGKSITGADKRGNPEHQQEEN